jgi:hypothetical protein
MERYKPRPIEFHDIRLIGEWRLKTYSIIYGDQPLNWTAFQPGIEMIVKELPLPPCTGERPGVGFLILHQGRNTSYLVLGWWDRENELPLRVYILAQDKKTWRKAKGSESICVWDLQVLWFEREAYVETILSGKTSPDPTESYLDRRLNVNTR